jgi:hypothetical protein
MRRATILWKRLHYTTVCSDHVIPAYATEETRFSVTSVYICCSAAGSGPVGCLAGDDLVRDATIEEMSQAVFSASLLGVLGGYIS